MKRICFGRSGTQDTATIPTVSWFLLLNVQCSAAPANRRQKLVPLHEHHA